MQLVSIKLTDFQAHEALEVRFAPGITTIIGPTDKGKSSILRALGWVAQNNIAGEEFIREGAKEASVRLVVTDGKRSHTIVRSKGKENSYSLDGKKLVAFGQGVPRDIAELLQLNEINFQLQHDAPFWFSETAGEVSRKLNTVIDLAIIDQALSNVGAAVRQCTERRAITEERLEDARKELQRLDAQKARVTEFNELKQKKLEANEAARDCNQLDALLQRIDSNNAHDLRTKSLSVQTVFNAAKAAVTLQRQSDSLADLIAGITAQQDAAVAPPSFLPVQCHYEEWMEAEDRVNALASMIERATDTAARAASARLLAGRREDLFHEKTKGQKCPLCGSQI